MVHAKLTTLFSQREIEKYYVAICVGTPKEGMIDAAIKRHPIHRKEMAVHLEGKEAKSPAACWETIRFSPLSRCNYLLGAPTKSVCI